jgi:2-succinyl-6-hydroxy-2,4-cyclohexadiene-1-carboxylate synthase
MSGQLPRLHWFSGGSAEPTVLLHGFTGSVASWSEVAGLVDGPVAGLHLPGHHPEAPVQDDFSASLGWVDEVLGAEGIEKARVIGYSLGARVALGLAVERPRRVASLTLIGVRPGLPQGERAARRRSDQRWIELLENAGIEAFVREWEALPLWSTQRAVAAERLAAQRAVRLAHDPAGLAGSLRTMGLAEMPDYRAAIGDIEVELQLVVGALDRRFRTIAEELCAAHPHIGYGIVPDAGHNVVLESAGGLSDIL